MEGKGKIFAWILVVCSLITTIAAGIKVITHEKSPKPLSEMTPKRPPVGRIVDPVIDHDYTKVNSKSGSISAEKAILIDVFNSGNSLDNLKASEKHSWYAGSKQPQIGEVNNTILDDNVYWVVRNDDENIKPAKPEFKSRLLYEYMDGSLTYRVWLHWATDGKTLAAFPTVEKTGKSEKYGICVRYVASHNISAKPFKNVLCSSIGLCLVGNDMDSTFIINFKIEPDYPHFFNSKQ